MLILLMKEITMRKERFTKHQIIAVLKSVEASRSREIGLSWGRDFRSLLLQLESEIRGIEEPDIKSGGWKSSSQTDVYRFESWMPGTERRYRKALKPAFKRDCQRRMKSGSSATLVEIFMPVDSCPSA